MNFIEKIKEKAKENLKTIVLPESNDRRVIEAAEIILKEKIANIIIIGTDDDLKESSIGLDISKATIINPKKQFDRRTNTRTSQHKKK